MIERRKALTTWLIIVVKKLSTVRPSPEADSADQGSDSGGDASGCVTGAVMVFLGVMLGVFRAIPGGKGLLAPDCFIGQMNKNTGLSNLKIGQIYIKKQ